MSNGTTSRAPQEQTWKVAPHLKVPGTEASRRAPTNRVAPPAIARPATPRPVPKRPPAPGRPAATPRVPCPGCQALLPAGSVICVECGYCLTTGRFLRNSTIKSRMGEEASEEQIGFFKLGAGMFTKPVQTMETFLYHAGRPDLLWKVGLFAVFGILVSAFMGSLGRPALFPAVFGAQVVQFIVFVGCLLVAGMVLGERSNFLGAAVGIGFVSACVQIAWASVLLGAWFSGPVLLQHPFLVIAGLLAFLAWALFMHVVAVRGVFACGTVVAIVISILAAIIDWFACAAILSALHLGV